MKNIVTMFGLVLTVIAGTGIAYAHDNNGAATTVRRPVPDTHQTRTGLAALTARLLDTRATLEERLSAASARQDRLAALIVDDPQGVLRQAVPAEVRASVPSAAQRYMEEHVTTEGDLEVLHEDGPLGSRYHYFLNRGGERLTLHFAADAPVLQTGDRVRVSGVRVQQAMALGSGTTNVAALALASPATLGAQNTAVILVRFTDSAPQQWLTAQNAQNIIMSDNSTSVSSFFREASYGQTWLTGDVYGPYTIPMSAVCSTGSIASYAEQAAKSQVGATKMATYKRLVYLFPGAGCGWWGMGSVGGSPSRTWVNGSFDASVVSHEMGHNFGLMHSHALFCDHVSVGSGCATIEYGDSFDVMGAAATPVHFNAVQKDLLGWLNYGVSPPITTVQTSGVYIIDPYESVGNDPKALKVKTPVGDWYYVEYRQALGFDAPALAGNDNVPNGVLVHLWRGGGSNGILLLDMSPEQPDLWRPALEVGGTFTDSVSGISISPVWVNGTAGVHVTVGSGGSTSCVRKNPTVAVSPAQQQGNAGTMLSYALSVTNNDSGCPSSSYSMQAVVPSQWSRVFSATSVSLASAATGSVTMQVTSGAAAPAGTYALSPTATSATSSASGQATYGVTTGTSGGTFSDAFNRADSNAVANGWTAVSGSYGIQGGMAVAQAAPGFAIQAGVNGQAVSARADFVRPTSTSGTMFGVVVRYRDAKNYYACYRGAGGSSQFKVSKVVNGIETVLKAVAVPQAPLGTPFTVSCSASGNIISVGDGSVVKASATDVALASGAVGVKTDKAGLKVDNFSASAQ
jgi:hypothetical protein